MTVNPSLCPYLCPYLWPYVGGGKSLNSMGRPYLSLSPRARTRMRVPARAHTHIHLIECNRDNRGNGDSVDSQEKKPSPYPSLSGPITNPYTQPPMPKKARHSEAAVAAMHAKITAVLTRLGPCLCRQIAAAIDCPVNVTSYFLRDMRRRGLVRMLGTSSYRAMARGACYFWALGEDSLKSGKPISCARPQLGALSGITPDDLTWMSYWRQPRTLRRQQRMEEAA